MVCLGNICRSPLAEGILKYKIKNKKIFVDSGNHHIILANYLTVDLLKLLQKWDRY